MSGGNQRSRSFTTVILDLDFVAALLPVCTPLLQRHPTKLAARPRASFVLAPYFLQRAASKHGLSAVSIFREIRVESSRSAPISSISHANLVFLRDFRKRATRFPIFSGQSSQKHRRRFRRIVVDNLKISLVSSHFKRIRESRVSWRSTGNEQGVANSFGSHGHRDDASFLTRFSYLSAETCANRFERSCSHWRENRTRPCSHARDTKGKDKRNEAYSRADANYSLRKR